MRAILFAIVPANKENTRRIWVGFANFMTSIPSSTLLFDSDRNGVSHDTIRPKIPTRSLINLRGIFAYVKLNICVDASGPAFQMRHKKTDNESRQTPSVLLWGGKGKARIVAEMLRESNAGRVRIIFDNTISAAAFATDAMFTNAIVTLKENLASVTHYVVCIGGEHGYARYKTAKCLERVGLKSITLIHERSFVEPSANVGQGCQVMPCAVIHKFSTIGEHSIVNTNATIDHECVIGKGVHIMGSAAIAGKIEIGDYATIGTNATILPFLKVGEGAYVGAGAVVTKDVPAYSVVAGVPAKWIRANEPKVFEELLIELVS